jgi:hypothetical protein
MTFNESVERGIVNYNIFGDTSPWGLFRYLKNNDIHQTKDRMEVIKKWFLSGRELYVNGSRRGCVIIKRTPELKKLLKTGFIIQKREVDRWGNGQTLLTLNRK